MNRNPARARSEIRKLNFSFSRRLIGRAAAFGQIDPTTAQSLPGAPSRPLSTLGPRVARQPDF